MQKIKYLNHKRVTSGGGISNEQIDNRLNGAQIKSLIEIMEQYTNGLLSEGQAINLISIGVNIDRDRAEKILKGKAM